MYDVISVKCEVYVIQELAQGGSLLDYIRDRKRISEDLAMRLFLQIVAGLQYCHQNEVRSVCHNWLLSFSALLLLLSMLRKGTEVKLGTRAVKLSDSVQQCLLDH